MEMGQAYQGDARSSAELGESQAARRGSIQLKPHAKMKVKYLDTYKQYRQEAETREGANSCSSISSLGAHRGGGWVSAGMAPLFSMSRELCQKAQAVF